MVKISDFFNKKDSPDPKKGPSGQEAKEAKPQEVIKKEAPVEKSAEIIPKKEFKNDFSFLHCFDYCWSSCFRT